MKEEVTEDDIQEIRNCIFDCRIKLTGVLGNISLVPSYIHVNFNLTGRVAGRAHRNEIKLNAGLFLRNKEDFFRQTIPHEYAHVVTYNLYPLEPGHHGGRWKHIMRLLGCDTKRYHNYDTSEVSKTRRIYELKCPCSIHKVGRNVYEKVLNGQKRRCFTCKGDVTIA